MPKIAKENIDAALLSLLVPGLGQLYQGRRLIGSIQILLGLVAVIVLVQAESLGISQVVAASGIFVLALWSIADALMSPYRTHI